MRWPPTTLAEVVETQKGFAFKSAWYSNTGRPIIRVSDFTANSVDSTSLVCIPEEIAVNYLKYELQTNDVVIQTVGSWPSNPASVVGKCIRVPKSASGGLLNQNAVKLSPSERLDNGFLYYLLQTPAFKDYIIGTAQGAASQAAITLDAIRSYEFELPSLSEQRRIAGILSAYDDLIENNLRRIQILEEMARALYREWFVEFRFPGHEKVPLVGSSKGKIPEGWQVKRLGEVAEEMRRNVSKGELDASASYVGLEHIPRRSLTLNAWEIAKDLGSNKLAFKKGELLFGKIRPYFHKVSVAPFDGLCSADTIVIRARQADFYASVVLCVSSDEFVAHASATSNGSKMPRANWSVLEDYPVVVPNGKVAVLFTKVIANIIQQLQTLQFQIQNLRETRDLLLSRLLPRQETQNAKHLENH